MMHVNNVKKSYMKQNNANFPQDTVYIHEINANSVQCKNLNICKGKRYSVVIVGLCSISMEAFPRKTNQTILPQITVV